MGKLWKFKFDYLLWLELYPPRDMLSPNPYTINVTLFGNSVFTDAIS